MARNGLLSPILLAEVGGAYFLIVVNDSIDVSGEVALRDMIAEFRSHNNVMCYKVRELQNILTCVHFNPRPFEQPQVSYLWFRSAGYRYWGNAGGRSNEVFLP